MKKTISKVLALTMALALMVSMLAGFGISAAGSATVSLSTDVSTVAPSGDVVVKATANPLSAGGIIGFTAKITYDATKFTYKAASAALLQAKDGDLSVNDDNGTLYILYLDNFPSNVSNPLAQGDLFSVTFTAKADATGSGDFAIAGTNASGNFADDEGEFDPTYGSAVSVSIQSGPAYTIDWTVDEATMTIKGLYEGLDSATFLAGIHTSGTVTLSTRTESAEANDYIGTGVTVTIDVGGQTYVYKTLLYGDLDGTGIVDTDDVFSCLDYVLTGLFPFDESLAVVCDVDRNDSIDTDDVFSILDYVLSGYPPISQS